MPVPTAVPLSPVDVARSKGGLMLHMRSWRLALSVGALLLATGCGPNSYAIARKSPGELKVVSDVDLCYAQQFWRSPQMLDEIKARRLDCSTGKRIPEPQPSTAKKPQKPLKPASGIAKAGGPKPPVSSRDIQAVDLDAATPGVGPEAPPVDLDAAPRNAGEVVGEGGGLDLDAGAP